MSQSSQLSMSASRSSRANPLGKLTARKGRFGTVLQDRFPLFPLMADVEHTVPRVCMDAHLWIDAAQVVALGALPYHNWGFALRGVLQTLYFSHLPLYDDHIFGTSHTGLFVIVCVAVACMVAILAYLLLSASIGGGGDVRLRQFGRGAAVVLRSLLYLVSSVAVIPLVQNLLAVSFCFQGVQSAALSRAAFGAAIAANGTTAATEHTAVARLPTTSHTYYPDGFPPTESASVVTPHLPLTTAATGHLLWFPSVPCGSLSEGGSAIGIASVAVTIIGVAALATIALPMVSLAFDMSPTSTHHFARAHTRLDVPYIAFKFFACVLMHGMLATQHAGHSSALFKGSTLGSFDGTGYYSVLVRGGSHGGPEDASMLAEELQPLFYYAVIVSIAAAALAVAYACVLPYYSMATNRWRVGVLVACSATAALSALSHAPAVRHYVLGEQRVPWGPSPSAARGGPSASIGGFADAIQTTTALFALPLNVYRRDNVRQAHMDALVVIVLAAAAYYVGYRLLASVRVSALFSHDRALLEEGLIRHTDVHFPRHLGHHEDIVENFAAIVNDMLHMRDLMEAHGIDTDDGPRGPRDDSGSSCDGGSQASYASDEPRVSQTEHHFCTPMLDAVLLSTDVEVCCRYLQAFADVSNDRDPTPYQLAFAAQLYAKGICKYIADPPSAARIRLAFAHFLLHTAGHVAAATEQLQKVLSVDCSLSTRYQAWKLGQRAAIIMRVNESISDEAFTAAKQRHREALLWMSNFWAALATGDGDRRVLGGYTRLIQAAKLEVNDIYTQLLKRHGAQQDVVSCFTSYCSTVIQDEEAFQQCLQCLRELRDRRVANAFRGARNKRKDEVLTPLPVEVLSNDAYEAEDTLNSATVNHATRVLLTVSTLLVLVAAALVGLTVVSYQQQLRGLDAVETAGRLRSIALEASAEAVALRVLDTSDSTGIKQGVKKLVALQRDMRTLFNRLFFDESISTNNAAQNAYFRQQQVVRVGGRVLSLWSLGLVAIAAIGDVANLPFNSTRFDFVVNTFPTTLAAALNHTVGLTVSSAAQTTVDYGAVMMSLCIAAAVVSLLAAFVVNYFDSKVEDVRNGVFRLFTFLTKDELRLLVSESRNTLERIEAFFTLSTKAKVISLVGDGERPSDHHPPFDYPTVDDNEGEEASPPGDSDSGLHSDHPSEKTETQAATTGDEAEEGPITSVEGREDGTDTPAPPAGALPQQRQQRSIENQAALQLLADPLVQPFSLALALLLIVALVAIVILLSISSSTLVEFEKSSREEINFATQIRRTRLQVLDIHAQVQDYIGTGDVHRLAGYVEHLALTAVNNVESLATRSGATPEELRVLGAAADALDALKQVWIIASCLTHAAFQSAPEDSPLRESDQRILWNFTALGRCEWPREESLLFVPIADDIGLRDFRTRRLRGSSIDLAGSPPAMLRLARTTFNSRVTSSLVSRLDYLLEKDFALSGVRADRGALWKDLERKATIASVVAALATLLSLYVVRLHRSGGRLLQGPLAALPFALLVACLIVLALSISVSYRSNASRGTLTAALSGGQEVQHQWIRALRVVLEAPRYFAEMDLFWLWRLRNVAGFSPDSDTDRMTRHADGISWLPPYGDVSEAEVTNLRAAITAAVGGDILMRTQGLWLGRVADEMETVLSRITRRGVIAAALRYTARQRLLCEFEAAYNSSSTLQASVIPSEKAAIEALLLLVAERDIAGGGGATALRGEASACRPLATVAIPTHPLLDVTFLSRMQWNAATEGRESLLFGPTEFSTPSIDLRGSPADLITLSRRILHGPALHTMALRAFKLIHTFADGSHRHVIAKYETFRFSTNAALMAAIIIAAFSVSVATVVVLYCVFQVMYASLTHSQQSNTEESTTKTGGVAMHSAGARRAAGTCAPLALLFPIIILVIVLGSVDTSFRAKTQHFPSLIDVATQRSSLAALIMTRATEMAVRPPSYVQNQRRLQRDHPLIRRVEHALYFGPNGQAFFGLLTDKVQDNVLMRRTAQPPFQTAETFNEMPNIFKACNETKGLELLARVSSGVGLVHDHEWSQLVRTASTATPATFIAKHFPAMRALFPALLMGLTISDDRYAAFAREELHAYFSIRIALAVTVLALALGHLAVLWTSFVPYLLAEESSSRLMMNFIPAKIKEDNPYLVGFVERGKIVSGLANSSFEMSESAVQDSILGVDILGQAQEAPVLAVDGATGNVIRFSSAAEAFFGLACSDAVDSSANLLFEEDIVTLLARGQLSSTVPMLLHARDGEGNSTPVDVYGLSQPQLAHTGAPTVHVITLADKSKEFQASKMAEIHQFVQNTNRECIVIASLEGVILDVNAATDGLFGYDTGALVGSNVRVLMPPDVALHHDRYVRRYAHAWRQRHNGEIPAESKRVVKGMRRSGEVFPVSVRVKGILFPGTHHSQALLAVIRDLSQDGEYALQSQADASLTAACPQAIVGMNQQGTICLFSRAAEVLFGFGSKEMLQSAVSVGALVPDNYPNHDNLVEQYLARQRAHVAGGGTLETLESTIVNKQSLLRARNKQGETFPIKIRVIEKKFHDESVFVAFITDATKSVKRQDTAVIAEAVCEHCMTAIVTIDDTGRVTRSNRAAELITGYAVDEASSLSIEGLFSKGVSARLRSLLSAQGANNTQLIQLAETAVIVSKAGHVVECSMTVRNIAATADCGAQFFVFLVDISSHRRNLRLKAVNEAALQLSTGPLVGITGDGILNVFSAAAEEAFGYVAGEVLGRNVSMLMPPHTAVRHDGYLQQYARTRRPTILDKSVTLVALRRSGETFPVTIVVRELRQAHRLTGAQAAETDASSHHSPPTTQSTASHFIAFMHEVRSLERCTEIATTCAAALRMLPEPVVILSNTGHITLANDAAKTLAGVSAMEQRAFGDFLIPASASALFATLKEYFASTRAKRLADQAVELAAARATNTTTSSSTKVKRWGQRRRGKKNGQRGATQLIDWDQPPLPGIDGLTTGLMVHGRRPFAAHVKSTVTGSSVTIVFDVYEVPASNQFTTGTEVELLCVGRPGERYTTAVGDTTVSGSNTAYHKIRDERLFIEAVQDALPRAVVAIDHMGLITFASNAAATLFGYARRELLGRNVKMLMPPQLAQQHDRFLEAYHRSRVAFVVGNTTSHVAVSKAGRPLDIELTVREVTLAQAASERSAGRGVGLLASAHTAFIATIADRTASNALGSAQALADLNADACPLPVIGTDTAGTITLWNAAATRCFGYARTAMVGQPVDRLMLDDDAAFHSRYMAAFAATGVRTAVGTTTRRVIVASDGTEVPVALTLHMVPGESPHDAPDESEDPTAAATGPELTTTASIAGGGSSSGEAACAFVAFLRPLSLTESLEAAATGLRSLLTTHDRPLMACSAALHTGVVSVQSFNTAFRGFAKDVGLRVPARLLHAPFPPCPVPTLTPSSSLHSEDVARVADPCPLADVLPPECCEQVRTAIARLLRLSGSVSLLRAHPNISVTIALPTSSLVTAAGGEAAAEGSIPLRIVISAGDLSASSVILSFEDLSDTMRRQHWDHVGRAVGAALTMPLLSLDASGVVVEANGPATAQWPALAGTTRQRLVLRPATPAGPTSALSLEFNPANAPTASNLADILDTLDTLCGSSNHATVEASVVAARDGRANSVRVTVARTYEPAADGSAAWRILVEDVSVSAATTVKSAAAACLFHTPVIGPAVEFRDGEVLRLNGPAMRLLKCASEAQARRLGMARLLGPQGTRLRADGHGSAVHLTAHRHDGSTVPLEARCAAASRHTLVARFTDLGPRIETARRVAVSRAVAALLPVPLIVVRSDGTVARANAPAVRLLRPRPDDDEVSLGSWSLSSLPSGHDSNNGPLAGVHCDALFAIDAATRAGSMRTFSETVFPRLQAAPGTEHAWRGWVVHTRHPVTLRVRRIQMASDLTEGAAPDPASPSPAPAPAVGRWCAVVAVSEALEAGRRAVVPLLLDPLVMLADRPLIITDAVGTIRFLNAAAGRLFDFEARQVIGRGVSILMPETLHERHAEAMRRAARRAGHHPSPQHPKGPLPTTPPRTVVTTAETRGGLQIPVTVAVKMFVRGGQAVFVAAITRRTDNPPEPLPR